MLRGALRGGASVLLRKAPARYEVYNDADGSVVGFFRILRERPDDFARAVALTPYSREEAERACDPETDDPGGPLDDLERARRFYVRSRQTRHGAPSRGRLGWRYEKWCGPTNWGTTVCGQWSRLDHLPAIAARLKAVQLEHDDALRVLARFDGPQTLFDRDPPYVPSTRTARWSVDAYAVELTDAGHRRLAEALHGVAGMVVLSGYDGPLYRELDDARGWVRAERGARVQSAAVRTEVLWLSPRTARGTAQLRLPRRRRWPDELARLVARLCGGGGGGVLAHLELRGGQRPVPGGGLRPRPRGGHLRGLPALPVDDRAAEIGFRPWIEQRPGHRRRRADAVQAGDVARSCPGPPATAGRASTTPGLPPHVAAWAIANPGASQGGLRHWGWC